tara:strand:+ start:3076 stop:3246 length:171 start_codon:yes stop_codon:yes gene_type:complete
MTTLSGKKTVIMKNSVKVEGNEFVLDWFNLFPWKITNKDFNEILTYYIDKRIEDAK